jgi:hypothetical protein
MRLFLVFRFLETLYVLVGLFQLLWVQTSGGHRERELTLGSSVRRLDRVESLSVSHSWLLPWLAAIVLAVRIVDVIVSFLEPGLTLFATLLLRLLQVALGLFHLWEIFPVALLPEPCIVGPSEAWR